MARTGGGDVTGAGVSWLRVVARVLLYVLGGVVALAALLAAAFYYFVYAPAPVAPVLSGEFVRDSIEIGGSRRTYATYIPADVQPGATLVLVLHGSNGTGDEIRGQSGYEFDRLADRNGFVVVYPDGVGGYWNACNRIGDYAANLRNVDDVGFLTALAARLAEQYALDRNRVFATGLSRGGSMALRLALEAPDQVRAVAAIGASLPTDSNFKCNAGARSAPVMIMNGVADPLNPFGGGEVALFGMFMRRGEVRSSLSSAQYFADINGLGADPVTESAEYPGDVRIDRTAWSDGDGEAVALVAIDGAGHVIPQSNYRFPRLLGPTPRAPNGPELIWQFFETQFARPIEGE